MRRGADTVRGGVNVHSDNKRQGSPGSRRDVGAGLAPQNPAPSKRSGPGVASLALAGAVLIFIWFNASQAGILGPTGALRNVLTRNGARQGPHVSRGGGGGDAEHSRHRRESRILTFHRRASRTPLAGDVTLYTQLSCKPHNRLDMMHRSLTAWEGPVSVAVLIQEPDELPLLEQMYDGSERLRLHVDLHVVFLSDFIRSLKLYKEFGIQMVYPINLLRNVAMENARTEWVLHVDVDFALNPPTHAHYRDYLAADLRRRRADADFDASRVAFVLPAFDREVPDAPLPADKAALREAYYATPPALTRFAADLCSACHAPTDYDQFFSADASYTIKFDYMYEPYVLTPRSAPRYHELLTGRHLNKNLHIWDLACDGFTFIVIHSAYLVHLNKHKIIKYVDDDFSFMINMWYDHQRRQRPHCVAEPPGRIGETRTSAANSCKQIVDSANAVGDGYYWIKPYVYKGEPFLAYCDMTTDGGGWMLVATQAPPPPFDPHAVPPLLSPLARARPLAPGTVLRHTPPGRAPVDAKWGYELYNAISREGLGGVEVMVEEAAGPDRTLDAPAPSSEDDEADEDEEAEASDAASAADDVDDVDPDEARKTSTMTKARADGQGRATENSVSSAPEDVAARQRGLVMVYRLPFNRTLNFDGEHVELGWKRVVQWRNRRGDGFVDVRVAEAPPRSSRVQPLGVAAETLAAAGLGCVWKSTFKRYAPPLVQKPTAAYRSDDRQHGGGTSCSYAPGKGGRPFGFGAHHYVRHLDGTFGQYQFTPANSCYQIIQAGHATKSGYYWIQPFAYAGRAFRAYCDLETDGGGWMLLATQAADSHAPLHSLPQSPTASVRRRVDRDQRYSADVMAALMAEGVLGSEIMIEEATGPDAEAGAVGVLLLPWNSSLPLDGRPMRKPDWAQYHVLTPDGYELVINDAADAAAGNDALSLGQAGYDAAVADPRLARGDKGAVWELLPLSRHFHPSVAVFARQLRAGEPIVYEGDPLRDFALMAFLDRFVNKNAKQVKPGRRLAAHARQAPAGADAAAHQRLALGSEAFMRAGAEGRLGADDAFFHRFLREKAARDASNPVVQRRAAKAAEARALMAHAEAQGEDPLEAYADAVMEAEIKRLTQADVDDDDNFDPMEYDYSESDEEEEEKAGKGGKAVRVRGGRKADVDSDGDEGAQDWGEEFSSSGGDDDDDDDDDSDENEGGFGFDDDLPSDDDDDDDDNEDGGFGGFASGSDSDVDVFGGGGDSDDDGGGSRKRGRAGDAGAGAKRKKQKGGGSVFADADAFAHLLEEGVREGQTHKGREKWLSERGLGSGGGGGKRGRGAKRGGGRGGGSARGRGRGGGGSGRGRGRGRGGGGGKRGRR